MIDAKPGAGALLPMLDDAAATLGCVRVAEGSAPGGTVLAQHINATLGQGRAAGRLFDSADPAQPERWRGCRAATEACCAHPASRDAMVAAARTTFGTRLGLMA